jgi:hypothetical protein
MGLFARFTGIIFSPAATFAAALKRPKPFGVLALCAVVIAGATVIPQLTPSGRQAVIDAQVEAMDRAAAAQGREVTEQQIQAVQRFAGLGAVFAIVGTFIWLPVSALIVTAVLWGIFNALLGGTASFKHVLTVVTHGMVIMAIGTAVTVPIMIMQGNMQFGNAGPFSLGALVPMLDSTSLISRLLKAVSVFSIWQTIVAAIGLAVLYKKKATGIAVGLLSLYFVFTAVMLAVFGRFMAFGS